MPHRPELAVTVPTGKAPLFARIAQALADEIARGRLRPGQRLPGTRRLAETLRVHRNTIVAAYGELVSQGWAQTLPASATVVSASIPERNGRPARAKAHGLARTTAYPVRVQLRTRDPRDTTAEFNLAGGLPDPRLVPATLLGRAIARVLRRSSSHVLEYGDPRGHPALREAIAVMLAQTRGLAVEADDIVITRGSQMGLFLLGGVLLQPGDTVAVEALGYEPAWGALQAHGATMVGTRVDAGGLDTAQLLDRAAPRAVYVTPHHQYPTTVPLAADRRLQLLSWAGKNRVAIIEDDYDNEYHYDGHPLLPLAASDRHGSVAYVGSLSKVVAPGLRIGWVVGPRNLIDRVVKLRTLVDAQGGLASEAAVAELLEEGELQRHIWRTKRAYRERRDALAAALSDRLGSALSFEIPAGGMALWVDVDPEINLQAWVRAARGAGVLVGAGAAFALNGRPCPNLRLGFSRHEPDELRAAVERLADALPRRRDARLTTESVCSP